MREEIDQSRLGWMGSVSFMSGGSLVFFGLGSFLASLYGGELAGTMIGGALLVHGIVELRARHLVLRRSDPSGRRTLWVNQLLLAVSVSLYALFQLFQVNSEAISKALSDALENPELKSLFQMVPVEALNQAVEVVPVVMRGLYFVVIGLAWLGCGATALYYRRKLHVITV